MSDVLERLAHVLEARKEADPNTSYVTSLHAKGLHLSPLVTPFHSLRDEGDAPPIPVQACFGGLMVVRRAAVSAGRCRYEPQAVTWAEAHFGFHECLRAERTRMAAEDMYSGGSPSDGPRAGRERPGARRPGSPGEGAAPAPSRQRPPRPLSDDGAFGPRNYH